MSAEIRHTFRIDTPDMKAVVRRAIEVARADMQSEARADIGPAPSGVLAIDFDDTLTAPGGVEAAVELRRRGYGLVVHTANADHDGIRSWLAARWPADAGPIPPVTDVKPQALAFIDDKAHRFTDWQAILQEFAGESFMVWHARPGNCIAPTGSEGRAECCGDVRWTTRPAPHLTCREIFERGAQA